MSGVTVHEFELLAFFGRDPEILDAGVPWVYNTLTYQLAMGPCSIKFEIAPSYKHVVMQIKNADQVVYDFDGDVDDVQYVETAANDQLLKILLGRGKELILKVRPSILLSERAITN